MCSVCVPDFPSGLTVSFASQGTAELSACGGSGTRRSRQVFGETWCLVGL